jgi:hypothetical protein
MYQRFSVLYRGIDTGRAESPSAFHTQGAFHCGTREVRLRAAEFVELDIHSGQHAVKLATFLSRRCGGDGEYPQHDSSSYTPRMSVRIARSPYPAGRPPPSWRSADSSRRSRIPGRALRRGSA